jgi:hypothetical protein
MVVAATVAQQEQSGLSVRAFCERPRTGEPSFYHWRKRLAARLPVKFTLVETGHNAPARGGGSGTDAAYGRAVCGSSRAPTLPPVAAHPFTRLEELLPNRFGPDSRLICFPFKPSASRRQAVFIGLIPITALTRYKMASRPNGTAAFANRFLHSTSVSTSRRITETKRCIFVAKEHDSTS